MLSRSPRGTWCDYCKMRWGVERREVYLPEKGKSCIVPQDAVWQITTKRHKNIVVRHYCHSCAQEVQDWQGTIWKLQEQIDYAQGKVQLDVQLGEL